MDKLENLKEIWQNQPHSDLSYSREDIHEMVQKKSSSIVMWILIISILEFLLPYLLYVFTDLLSFSSDDGKYGLNDPAYYYSILDDQINYFYIAHFLIFLAFFYLFYKNYRNISALSSVKTLLENILKTRRTVKYYIYVNLALAAIIGLQGFYVFFSSEAYLSELPENADVTVLWITAIILYSIFLVLFWCFYRLIYGYFLRKLQRNYAELRKSD